jgi:hypothetical protein
MRYGWSVVLVVTVNPAALGAQSVVGRVIEREPAASALRRRYVEGDVLAQFVVDTTGRVADEHIEVCALQ